MKIAVLFEKNDIFNFVIKANFYIFFIYKIKNDFGNSFLYLQI
jgi:hypothetical protein